MNKITLQIKFALLIICLCSIQELVAQQQIKAINPCKNRFSFEFPKSFTFALPIGVCEAKIGSPRYFNRITDLFYPTKKSLKKGLFYLEKNKNSWVIKCNYESKRNYTPVKWTNTLVLRYFDGKNAILERDPTSILFLNKKDKYLKAFTPARLKDGHNPFFYSLYFVDDKLYPLAAINCVAERIELNTYEYKKDVLYVNLLENSFKKGSKGLSQKNLDTLEKILFDKKTKIIKASKRAPVEEPTLYKDVPLWMF